jgi:hypothetical protein
VGGIRRLSEAARVQKVVWFLQSSPHGGQFLIYNGGEDLSRLARDFFGIDPPLRW